MNKVEFKLCLEEKLKALPQNEIQKSVEYYLEMIDDRIEDGMSEEEAIIALGDIDVIVNNIMLDRPLSSLMKEKMKSTNGLKTWEVILLVLGFPVWFPLVMSFFAVIFSVYVTVWSIIISLWAVVFSLIIVGIVGVGSSILFMIRNGFSGLFILGCSICCIGLSVLAFFAVKFISVCLIKLTGKFLRAVKSIFIKKEA